ncbi:MAG: hypothetical protein DMG05_20970 [Acidobacteria bacterium]|nr:MAG: hypothetical protein DMG05_20970 [Acidobacteriota bacterium]
MRLGGSLALPISAGFEFFHTFRGQRGSEAVHANLTYRVQIGWRGGESGDFTALILPKKRG